MLYIRNFISCVFTLLATYEDIFDFLGNALNDVAFLDFKFWLSDLVTVIKYLLVFIILIPVLFFIAYFDPLRPHRTYDDLGELDFFRPANKPDRLERIFLDDKRVRGIVEQFSMLNISPAEYNWLINEPLTGMNIFRLVLLDFIRRSIITVNTHTLLINMERMDELKDFERQVLHILLSHMNFSDQGIYQSISLVDFINHLAAKHNQIVLASNELKKMLMVCNRQPSVKKGANAIKAYILTKNVIQDIKYNYQFLTTAQAILDYYGKYQHINLMDLYAMASVTPLSDNNITIDEFNIIYQDRIDLNKFYYELAYILDISAARMSSFSTPNLTFESNE